ncbi:MAG: non-ribosomal peptide synthetase, partial [bacterium]|nr:non-ribosomal peptide synthetase [bacterium]
DGVSWRILLEDFSTAYNQIKKGQPIRLPYKTTSFKEWAQKLSLYAAKTDTQWFAKEIEYWKKVENKKIVPLPVDMTDETNVMPKQKYCENVTVSLSKEETEKLLKKVHHAYNTEINDLLLTALGRAINAWTGESRVFIDLEGHGRETLFDDVDISRTVGWFTTQFPVVLTISGVPHAKPGTESGNQTPPHFLSLDIRQTKETLRNIPNKGIGYGILKYLAPDANTRLGGDNGLQPEITFNYLGQFGRDTGDGLFSMSTLSSGQTQSPDSPMPGKLNINGLIVNGKMLFDFIYSKTQYHQETIVHLAGNFKENLLAIIEHCRDKKETRLTPGDYWPEILTIAQLEEIEKTILLHWGEPARGIEKMYPLSPMQEGMLFHYIYNKNSNMYFEQFVLNIRGPLDRSTFDKSLRILVQKYDVLRTNFVRQGVERPVQVVLKSKRINVYFQNISRMEEEEKNLFAKEFARKDRQKGFDLSRDNLLRVSILQTGDDSFRLVWSMHHIIIDGWCTGILFGDFFDFYHYFRTRAGEDSRPPHSSPLKELYRYIDYIRWLEKQDKKEALSFWKNALQDYGEPTALPKTRGQSKTNHDDFQKEHLSFILDDALTQKLEDFAKNINVTLNVIFNCLWGLLLHRYNNTGDAVFGSVVSGRPAEVEGVDEMVGLFINTMPV